MKLFLEKFFILLLQRYFSDVKVYAHIFFSEEFQKSSGLLTLNKLTNNNSGNSRFLNLFNFFGLFAYTQKIWQTQTGGDQLSLLLKIQIVQTVAPCGSHYSDVFHFGRRVVLGSVVHSARFFGTRNHEHTTESNRHYKSTKKRGQVKRAGQVHEGRSSIVYCIFYSSLQWWGETRKHLCFRCTRNKKKIEAFSIWHVCTAPENSRKAFCQV